MSDPVGDDGLLEPPRPLPRPGGWLDRQLAKQVPRGLRWTDRVPAWAVPLIVAGLMGGLAALVLGGPRLAELIRTLIP